MADDFKALIAKVATGASLTREEAASAFDRMMSGEATPSQMGGAADGLARARRNRRRDHRRGHHHARQDAGRESAARRRSTWSAPAAMPPARTTSRPAPPSSSPAPACRSPSTATARCRRNRAPPTCCRRSASRSTSTPDEVGALHPRGRHRLHVRAGASSGDEERRPDPRRARHPHHLQSARAAVEPGRASSGR